MELVLLVVEVQISPFSIINIFLGPAISTVIFSIDRFKRRFNVYQAPLYVPTYLFALFGLGRSSINIVLFMVNAKIASWDITKNFQFEKISTGLFIISNNQSHHDLVPSWRDQKDKTRHKIRLTEAAESLVKPGITIAIGVVSSLEMKLFAWKKSPGPAELSSIASTLSMTV